MSVKHSTLEIHGRQGLPFAAVPAGPEKNRTRARWLGAVLIACLLGLSDPAVSAEMPDTLRLKEIVAHLASPELMGRRCGEEGGALARAYLKSRLEALELPPAIPAGYAQAFAVEGQKLAANTAVLAGPGGRRVGLTLSVRLPLAGNPGSHLKLWPAGQPAPSCDTGDILVRHGPAARGDGFSPSTLQAEAGTAGAAALVLVPHPDDADGLYARYHGRARRRDTRLHRLHGDPGECLLAYADPGEAQLLLSGDAGRPWRLELPEREAFALRGENLLAGLPGGGTDGERVLLLIAHYDHLGKGEDGSYFPGADDNAAAVAALLELARLLKGERLPFQLRFLFADGEELGLLGAESYLRRHGRPWRVLNLDSVGRAGVDSYRKLRDPSAASEHLMIHWQSEAAAPWVDRLAAALAANGFAPQPGVGPMFAMGGDHHAFARDGVPSIFLFGGFHSDYNTPNDRAEHILPSRLARLVAALRDWILALE